MASNDELEIGGVATGPKLKGGSGGECCAALFGLLIWLGMIAFSIICIIVGNESRDELVGRLLIGAGSVLLVGTVCGGGGATRQ